MQPYFVLLVAYVTPINVVPNVASVFTFTVKMLNKNSFAKSVDAFIMLKFCTVHIGDAYKVMK